jgi:hypothetical protein
VGPTCQLKDLFSPRYVLPPRYYYGRHHLAIVIGLLRVPPNSSEATNGWVVTSSCSLIRPLLLPRTESSDFPLFPIFKVNVTVSKFSKLTKHSGGRAWVVLERHSGRIRLHGALRHYFQSHSHVRCFFTLNPVSSCIDDDSDLQGMPNIA